MGQELQALFRGRGQHDLVLLAVEQAFEHLTQIRVVIDDQDVEWLF
jgi:hypothetical protein